jgi:hypothetical protein
MPVNKSPLFPLANHLRLSAGKWLVMEQVTFSSMEVPTWPAFFLLVVTDPPGDPFSRAVEHTMAVDDRQTDAATTARRW